MVLKPKFDKVKKQSLRSGELKHVLSQENIKLELAFLKIPKFKFSRHLIYALVAVILVLSGISFVYKIPVGNTSLKINSPLLRIGNNRNVIYFKTATSSEPFTFADVTLYLPYETDLFIEINNLKEMSDLFSFNLTPFNNISEFADKAFLSHSIQDGKDAWIILLPIKKDDDATFKFIDNFVNSYWKANLNDGFLVISSGSDLFNLVKDVRSQKTKSLVLNPQFQKSLENLQKSGSIMVVFLNTVGRKQFEEFSAYYKNQKFLDLMDEITKTGYNYFILKGYK